MGGVVIHQTAKNDFMQLILEREYHASGTNGHLYIEGLETPFCYTIELPWQNNLPMRSCIPEGTYPIVKRYSKKFKQHLQVVSVPGREFILIHPANHALLQLKGCIAPVSVLTGEGLGTLSQRAFLRLYKKVSAAIEKDEAILLTICPRKNREEIKQNP